MKLALGLLYAVVSSFTVSSASAAKFYFTLQVSGVFDTPAFGSITTAEPVLAVNTPYTITAIEGDGFNFMITGVNGQLTADNTFQLSSLAVGSPILTTAFGITMSLIQKNDNSPAILNIACELQIDGCELGPPSTYATTRFGTAPQGTQLVIYPQVRSFTIAEAPVPEPAALATVLSGLSLLGVLGARRRPQVPPVN